MLFEYVRDYISHFIVVKNIIEFSGPYINGTEHKIKIILADGSERTINCGDESNAKKSMKKLKSLIKEKDEETLKESL